MYCSIANLNREKVEALQNLEKKIGKTVVAFSCTKVKASKLKEEQLKELKAVEKKIGVTLVAVR